MIYSVNSRRDVKSMEALSRNSSDVSALRAASPVFWPMTSPRLSFYNNTVHSAFGITRLPVIFFLFIFSTFISRSRHERAQFPREKSIATLWREFLRDVICQVKTLHVRRSTRIAKTLKDTQDICPCTISAPFVQVNMNPHLPGVGETGVHKDAIIFTGHNFMGGAQSPGVLVAKRSVLRDEICPEEITDYHLYLRDPEFREESGTGGVVESIRCGLAVQLKESVTHQAIIARQDKICRYFIHFMFVIIIKVGTCLRKPKIK